MPKRSDKDWFAKDLVSFTTSYKKGQAFKETDGHARRLCRSYFPRHSVFSGDEEIEKASKDWLKVGMRHHDSIEQFRLLYVEDTPSDVSLVQMALADFSPKVTLTAVSTGTEALSYLNQQGQYAGVQRPHLVLLDLNLPGLNGEEVLLAIKSNQELKALPVVVFTSAADEAICDTVYRDNANCCVTKPFDLDSFLNTVQQTCRYWFTIVNLPTSQKCAAPPN